MMSPRTLLALLDRGERRRAFSLLVLLALAALFETLGIGLVIPAVTVLMQRDLAVAFPPSRPILAAIGNPTQSQLVVWGMLLLVVVYAAKTAFCAWVVRKQTRFSFDVQARVAQQLFANYLRQPYTFHLQRNSAQLLRNVVNEVRELTNCALLPAGLLLAEGLVLASVALLLLFIQPLGTTVVVLVMLALVWTYQRLAGGRVTSWGEARQLHDGLRIQHLQQGLGAAKDVKLLGRETEFLDRHWRHTAASAAAASRHHTLVELPRLGLEFLGVSALAVLVLTMLASGSDLGAIVPTAGVFAAAAFRLMPSANRLINALHLLRYGLPVVTALEKDLSLVGDHVPPRRAPLLPFRSQIEVREVHYTYPLADSAALQGLTLHVGCGEAVGLIGPSGSGKSTAVDVMLGLLQPDSGHVLVDGRDTRADLRAWQDQIGYVPQTIYLTDDTIRRNVAFGVPDAEIDDGAVRRAIQAAQLDDVVASRSEGLEAVLGERGVRLSGGQRQRMGIARALYHDPAVLVLDEATSALDSATEQDVMDAVMALHGRKTIVVIAHRLSTVARCDRVYRLEHGRTLPGEVADWSQSPQRAIN